MRKGHREVWIWHTTMATNEFHGSHRIAQLRATVLMGQQGANVAQTNSGSLRLTRRRIGSTWYLRNCDNICCFYLLHVVSNNQHHVLPRPLSTCTSPSPCSTCSRWYIACSSYTQYYNTVVSSSNSHSPSSPYYPDTP
jgi:hypothetical protein